MKIISTFDRFVESQSKNILFTVNGATIKRSSETNNLELIFTCRVNNPNTQPDAQSVKNMVSRAKDKIAELYNKKFAELLDGYSGDYDIDEADEKITPNSISIDISGRNNANVKIEISDIPYDEGMWESGAYNVFTGKTFANDIALICRKCME